MHYTSARVSKRGNRYRAFLSFKDEAGTSRQVSKTLDARGISQAKRELAAWRAEMEARAEAEDRKGASGRKVASMAVPDYVDRYVAAAESARTVEQSTIKGYRSSAKLIRREFSDAKVGELTTEMVADWEAQLTKGGMSSSSVGKAHRLLKMIMQQAVFAQAVDRNPLDFVKPPKRRNVKPGINALDRQGRAEMLAKLGELELTEVTVAALISIYTGLREGEVCGLQWRDVDIAAGVLWVRRSIGVGDKGSYVKAPKTDKTRDVALPASLAKVLDKWKVHQALAFAEKGVLLRPDHYVIGDPLGFLCPATVSRGWKLLSTMIGIKGTAGRIPTFHDLRHTWATMYLAAGGDVKMAASNLGHANAAMTLNVYASCDPEAKRRAAELTERAMTGGPEA